MARGRTAAQLRSIDRVTRTATYRALNRVGQSSRRKTLQILSKEIGLTQAKLGIYVVLVRAGLNRLEAAVRVIPHTFNIASFAGTRQVGKGKSLKLGPKGARVRTKITAGGVVSSAWGKRKLYPGAFLIHGGRTAVHRIGKARLPIEPIYGPRVQREFTYPEAQSELKADAEQRLPVEMKHELDFAIRQALQ